MFLLNQAKLGDKKTHDLKKLTKKAFKKTNESQGFGKLLAGFKVSGMEAIQVDHGALFSAVLPKSKTQTESTSLDAKLVDIDHQTV